MTSSFGELITSRIDQLSECTDEEGKLTRLYLSEAHKAAARLVGDWMSDAGMAVRVDAAGNVVGRIGDAKAPTLLIGSHIDSVRDAGRFDGSLGVIAGIAVADTLKRHTLPFAIEVIAFGDEEGVRFPSTLSGSRALAGTFDPKQLDERDALHTSRRAALVAFGCNPDKIADEARDPSSVLGYVELHIEQGPVLEQHDLPVGIVTAICGATRGIVEITGKRGHAGTVPMRLRRDTLAAAAEIILAIEGRAKGDDGLVATVGQIELTNPAPNTIPGEARFSVDVRAPSDSQRSAAVADMHAAIERVARTRRVTATFRITHDAPATPCDARLNQLLEESIASCGIRSLRLASGAGHDAMAFRDRIPIAMLFVRCRAGISHHPAEFSAPADIDVAARVLQNFVERLAASLT